MALVSKPYTFSAGATIVAAEHNSNFDTIYNEFNGSIDNSNISTMASIADSKLAQITTSGKVSGAAITLLTSVPSGAGILPIANIASGTPTGSKFVRDDGTLQLPTATAANALSGSVIQKVYTESGAVSTGTTALPIDDTIPQITEGDQFMTRAITPNDASNTLEIVVTLYGASTTAPWAVALFQDSTADALAVVANDSSAGNYVRTLTFTHHMTAGTTSSTTFRVRAGAASGTFTFNGSASSRKFGGAAASSITIREYKA